MQLKFLPKRKLSVTKSLNNKSLTGTGQIIFSFKWLQNKIQTFIEKGQKCNLMSFDATWSKNLVMQIVFFRSLKQNVHENCIKLHLTCYFYLYWQPSTWIRCISKMCNSMLVLLVCTKKLLTLTTTLSLKRKFKNNLSKNERFSETLFEASTGTGVPWIQDLYKTPLFRKKWESIIDPISILRG